MPGPSGVSRRDTRRVVLRRLRVRRLAVVTGVAVIAAFVTLVAVDAMPSPGTAGESMTRALPDQPSHRYGGPDAAVGRAPSDDAGAAAGTVTFPALTVTAAPETPREDVKPPAPEALPADSGSGKRVVYAIGAQQVWLVDEANEVARTYRVSGSRYGQLDAGAYEVFSTSRHATSWHGTETMEYMVRFHRGARSNIGFHDIPVNTSSGTEVQTLSELGTPLSDGCVRQDVVDAAALWEFAPVGTPVVVLR